MKTFATLFCHVSDSLSATDTQVELQRQHDILAQHANQKGLPIERCFSHVGDYDFENSDNVWQAFLRSAQEDDLGLVFVESMDKFPITQQEHIPLTDVCFIQEGVRETIGSEDTQIEINEPQPRTVYVYWGL